MTCLNMKYHSYFTMLFNFILCEMFGGFDVNKVLSHLVQLRSFHKKLEGRGHEHLHQP